MSEEPDLCTIFRGYRGKSCTNHSFRPAMKVRSSAARVFSSSVPGSGCLAESIAAHARIYRMLSEDNVKDACNLLAYHINAGFTARARHLLEDLARSNC